MNLREFVSLLDDRGLLVHIRKEVDVKYEVSSVMKELDGKPLIFENVKGFDMPVVANVCSTRELVALGLETTEDKIIPALMSAIENPKEPQTMGSSDYEEVEPDLSKIPILTYYPFDGGPYIASSIIIAKDPEYGINASYQRTMIIDKENVVMRILPRDFNTFLERGLNEFAVCVGNTIPMMLAAAISTKTGNSEINIANGMGDVKLVELGGHTVPESELVMIFETTGRRTKEGPFLDLTETPDIIREERVFHLKKMFRRKDSLYHALLPGGLEHKVLMGMPREPTIWKEVSKVCDCRDVLVTPGGCSWLHAAVKIKKKGPEDGKKAIDAAFEGHKSMKHVFIVDDDIDITNPSEIEWAMATRFQGDKDIYIFPKSKGSSLDPSADPNTRETCKVGFDLTIPWGKNPEDFKKPKKPMEIDIKDYLEV
ncbi:MAG: UbiD family decarboxylase [Candidatus Aenigmarchaeota archaeon]|nr:UbiD family decarboxylase [Candidatus Aenigmarchaeota archaeon]